MKVFAGVLLIVGALLFSACSQDESASSSQNVAPTIENLHVLKSDGSAIWSRAVGSSPVLATGGRYLYLASGSRSQGFSVHKLSLSDGSEAWSFNLDAGSFINRVEIMGDKAIIFTDGRPFVRFIALDLDSGREVWVKEVKTGSTVQFAAIDGRVVYSDSGGHRVVALDSDTGSEVWAAAASSVKSPPLVAGDSVIALASRALRSIDPQSGRVNWEVSTGGDAHSAHVGVNRVGAVVFGSGSPPQVSFNVFDLATGEFVWSYSNISITPTMADNGLDLVFLLHAPDAQTGATMQMAELSTGKELWSRDWGDQTFGLPEIMLNGDVLVTTRSRSYMGAEKFSLMRLSGEDGSVLWETLIEGMSYWRPEIHNDVGVLAVSIGESGGGLDAYDLVTGTQLWSQPMEAEPYENPVAQDDMFIYAGRQVYAE